jgi:hypothetical protein
VDPVALSMLVGALAIFSIMWFWDGDDFID